MLLTITTTHRPATDLGFLLVKHPDRLQSFEVTGGRAHLFYPEATDERCTAALLLDVDGEPGPSHLSVALGRVLRTALRGESRDRPELAGTAVPLELHLPAVRCSGDPETFFGPLGWTVEATRVPLDTAHPEWGASRFVNLTLRGNLRLADALNHVYVLLPVLDDAKHYWVTAEEVEKLLRAGAGWLAEHPAKALIARRYLAHRKALTNEALARLSDDTDAPVQAAPRPESLAVLRRAKVVETLIAAGASRVLDLGCGPGALLGDLVRERRFTEIVGADVSAVSLDMAARRLRLDRLPDRQQTRIRLLQTALTYRDSRLTGYDAAVLMEVVEHVDPPRLPALAAAVFGHAAPKTVVVTTPNVEYNVHYPNLGAGRFRHPDHRFEWDRAQFAAWCDEVAARYSYTVVRHGIGDEDPETGAPTQMAVFTR